MSFINLEQLPFVGMSYEFVGETQGVLFGRGLSRTLHLAPLVD